jgi:hypothetical protein
MNPSKPSIGPPPSLRYDGMGDSGRILGGFGINQ